MIDTAVILFSLGMVAFVTVRAAILDRRLPWFSPPGSGPNEPPPAGAEGRLGRPASNAAVPPRVRQRQVSP